MDPINPWLDASEVRHLAEKLIRPVEKTLVAAPDPGFETSFVGFLEEDENEQTGSAAEENPIIPKLQPIQKSMPVAVMNPPTTGRSPFTPKPTPFTAIPAPFTAVNSEPAPSSTAVPFTPIASEPESSDRLALKSTNSPEQETPGIATTPFTPVTSEPAIPNTIEPEVPITTQSVAAFSPATILSIQPTQDTSVSDSRFTNFRNWLTDYLNAKEIFIIDQTGEVIFDESRHGRLHFIARDLILHVDHPHNVRIKFGPATNLELVPCDSPIGLVVVGALFPVPLNGDQIQTIRKALR